MLDQITPLILTFNEAANIERNLSRLSWANDIVIVDSFSADETIDLAERFPKVRTFQRTFDTHAQQWNFGLKETGIKTPWVLALDADYIVTDEFISELKGLDLSNEVSGFSARFVYCIQGKPLRSGVYPPVTVLYRHQAATYLQDGHTQRVRVEEQLRVCMLSCCTMIANLNVIGLRLRLDTRNLKHESCCRPNARVFLWQIEYDGGVS